MTDLTIFTANCGINPDDKITIRQDLSGPAGCIYIERDPGVRLSLADTIRLIQALSTHVANHVSCLEMQQAGKEADATEAPTQAEAPPSPGLKVGDSVRVTAEYGGYAPHDMVGTIRVHDTNDGSFLVEFAGWTRGHNGNCRVSGSKSCWWVWPMHLEKAEPIPAPDPDRYPHGCVVNIPGVGHRMVAHCWSQGDYVPMVINTTGSWIEVADYLGVTVVDTLDLPEGLLIDHRSCSYDRQDRLSIVEYLALVNPTVFHGMSAEDVKEMTMADGWWMKRQGFPSSKIYSPPILEYQGIDEVNHYKIPALAELLERRYS